jgi:hypothetical protein
MTFTSRYALQRHGPRRLVVRRSRTWDEVSVRLDAVELGPTNKAALREGVEYKLYDRSVLRLRLEPGPRDTFFLMITRNGHPLPESDGDPVKILRFTLIMIGLCAATQLFFALTVIINDRADASIWWALWLGLAIIVLGLFAWHRSLPAMVLACGIFFGEVAVFFVSQMRINIGSVWSLCTALGILGWLLLRGVKAVRDLNAVSLPIRRPPEHAA